MGILLAALIALCVRFALGPAQRSRYFVFTSSFSRRDSLQVNAGGVAEGSRW